jgi:hypothetical protein
VNTLNKELETSAAASQSDGKAASKSSQNDTSDKDTVKEEISDSFKKEAEDTLGDFDLKDFDFDGMNNDTLQDLMDDLPENFIDTFDFEGKIENDIKTEEELAKSEAGDPTAPSSNGTGSSSSGGPPALSRGPAASQGPQAGGQAPPGAQGQAPNAAEALKMMAQQHQQPPVSMASGPPYPGPGAPYNMHPASRGPPPTAMPGGPPAHGSPRQGPAAGNPSQSPHHPVSPHEPSLGPRPPGPQEGDPRLRAAVQQRFRLGNPQSMGGVLGPGGQGTGGPGMQGHPAMMAGQQRMPGMMPMQGGPMMMSQQQVSYVLISIIPSLPQ